MTVAHRATVPQSLHPCRVTRRRDVASHCLRCIGNGVNIHEDLIGAGPIVAATSGERCEANGEQRLGGTRRRRRGSLRRAAGREQIDSQSDDVMPSSVPSSLSKGRDGASASVPEAQEEERAEVSAALALLRFYKSTISPLLPPSCRFLPTCSGAMSTSSQHQSSCSLYW